MAEFDEFALQLSAFSKSHMDLKPFVRLAAPRAVNRPELPPDLAEFYARHAGVGLDSSPDRPVRLCKLDEVARIGWQDLHIVTADEVPEGWEGFAGFRVGMGRKWVSVHFQGGI